jgi:hypothetical protein
MTHIIKEKHLEIELYNDQSQNLTLDKFGVEILLNQTSAR